MKFLLDTHTIIWYINDDVRLPNHVKQELQDDSNDVYVSVLSFWEISIKSQQRKLDLNQSLPEIAYQLRHNGFRFMPVRLNHIYHLNTLSTFHKDPFDRMLIAQSFAEECVIVGCDKIFDDYQVRRLW